MIRKTSLHVTLVVLGSGGQWRDGRTGGPARHAIGSSVPSQSATEPGASRAVARDKNTDDRGMDSDLVHIFFTCQAFRLGLKFSLHYLDSSWSPMDERKLFVCPYNDTRSP